MALPIAQFAAGIYRKEIDQSNNLTVAGTSVGAIVVRAPQGPVNREVIVNDYPTYVQNFGNPVFSAGDVPLFGYGNYAAEEFLNESNELHVIRAFDAGDKYPMVRFKSTFDSDSIWSTSADIGYDGVSGTMSPTNPDSVGVIQVLDTAFATTFTGNKLMLGALGPGTDGQNIGVTIETFNVTSAGVCDWFMSYDNMPTASAAYEIITSASNGTGGFTDLASFSAALDTAGYNWLEIFPIATQVAKINVYVKGANQTWSDLNYKLLTSNELAITDLTPVETFYGTIGFVKDGNGKQLRLKEVINGVSQYVYVCVGNSQLAYEIKPTTTGLFGFGGGAISYNSGLGDGYVLTGWDFFASREYATVNILICPDSDTATKQKVANLAANRMDCCAVGQSGVVTDITVEQVLKAEKFGYKNPSYIGLYAGWDLKYDQVNDRNLYVPKALYGASLFARVDRTGNTWDAPAGDPNGILPTLGQNKVFSFTDIGRLQQSSINTSRFLRSTGHTMWGQRTAQTKNTALNRINVRRLLIYIENTVEQTLFPFLFNIVNDEKSRLRITTLIQSFLDGVLASGGVTDAQVICTEKNNTTEIIDNNQMVVDMFVIPAKTVEIIQLNTRIVKTGVSFNEIVI